MGCACAAALVPFVAPSLAAADFVFYQATSDGNIPSHLGSGNATGFPRHGSTGNGEGFDFDHITSPSNPTGAWYMNVNDPNTSSEVQFYRTDGFNISTGNYYVSTTLRVNSLDAGQIIADHIQGGTNNHSALQMYFVAGADHAIGGTGINADKVELVDYYANAVIASADADLANFHTYTLQRTAADGKYYILIDGVWAGEVDINSVTNAPNADREQTFPLTDKNTIANYDVQYFAYDTENVLVGAVPEPSSLGVALVGVGYAALRRRRA